jgi:hypothetical protein
MTAAELPADVSSGANRAGLYFAFLQLVFTLGRTTYSIYLAEIGRRGRDRARRRDPDLDAGSGDLHHHRYRDGNRRRSDRHSGRPSQRVRGSVDRAILRRLCRAALHCRRGRKDSSDRADRDLGDHLVCPPRAAADPARKYCARPQLPFLAALVMLGYCPAGAASPYLGVVLRDADPRLPFVISSMVLLLTTLGPGSNATSHAPRRLRSRPSPQSRSARCRCCSSSR